MSPLLFVMAMILISCILRTTKPAYVFKNESKLNHLIWMTLRCMQKIKIVRIIDPDAERIFSNDFGMEFGLDKCATIKMKRGKLVEMERLPLAEGNKISSLEEDGEYKYLRILEEDNSSPRK